MGEPARDVLEVGIARWYLRRSASQGRFDAGIPDVEDLARDAEVSPLAMSLALETLRGLGVLTRSGAAGRWLGE